MACRVGITTDLKRRRKEWEREYKTILEWEILHVCVTKEEAQSLETQEAWNRKCESSGGGDDPDDSNKPWFVYYFRYLPSNVGR